MIEHMERIGKIEKTGHYNIYRIGKPMSVDYKAILNLQLHNV
jgi:hypothetical protein